MYVIPAHHALAAVPETVQLNVPPIAGFGLTQFAPNGLGTALGRAIEQPPVVQAQPQPIQVDLKEVSPLVMFMVLGVGSLVVGSIGWLVYKDIQLKFKIAEKEGAAGLLKYEAGKAAASIATDVAGALTRPDRDQARPNRARPKRRKRSPKRS